MSVARRFICTYTKDIHKKKKKKWEDGVLDLDVDGGISRLYRADDDDGKPVGEALARKALNEREVRAALEKEQIKDFEGFDIEPDDEVGESGQDGGDGGGWGGGGGGVGVGAGAGVGAAGARAACAA